MKYLTVAALASTAVLALGAQAQASPNLITNGSFESGLTGWTTFGDFKYSGVANPAFDVSDLNGQTAQNGSNQVYLGTIGDTGGIFQTVADVKGGTYQVTGWYSGQGSINAASSLKIGIHQGTTFINLNPGAVDGIYHEFTGTFVGTGFDTLTITSRNDVGYNLVDNFSITATSSPAAHIFALSAVPEPATWTIMLVGVFGVGAVLRGARRKAMADVAAA